VVSVLLVDDHSVVRTGLRTLLETAGGVEVMGEASSGKEAVELADELKPDVVIMDLAMPGMDGIQATRRIRELGLGTRVLVLTIHDADEYLVPALNAGASGFLSKSVADTDLLGAVEAVAHGHSYLPRQAAALLARHKRQDKSGLEPGYEVLSSRERTAIKLYASGFSTSEMGEEMILSPKTVEGYLARAKSKLGLHTRRDIVRFAIEAGLLRADGER
jgi:two-component system response regulator NreC